MITKLVANSVSPAGAAGSLSILIFHRVFAEPDPLHGDAPDARKFDSVLRWLTRSFNVLPLDAAVEQLQSGSLPARAVSITFDDGYRDNFSVALPLLLKHEVCATFFIATGFLDGGCMWNDIVAEAIRNASQSTLDLSASGLGSYSVATWEQKQQAMSVILGALKHMPPPKRLEMAEELSRICVSPRPHDLMMTTDQVQKMRAAGMQIGAHTRSHPILASLDEDAAQEEISGSRSDLENMLDESVTLFAYPNGRPAQDYHAQHVKMVEAAGYRAAVSTAAGASKITSDILQLPRFTPWDDTELRFGLRLANNIRRCPQTV
ncbi:MAG: polysaccharide deacetylase family protein [Halioglobus sp.]|nr:polysaccharide deacetylase family protein [Halioglobus sp.]